MHPPAPRPRPYPNTRSLPTTRPSLQCATTTIILLLSTALLPIHAIPDQPAVIYQAADGTLHINTTAGQPVVINGVDVLQKLTELEQCFASTNRSSPPATTPPPTSAPTTAPPGPNNGTLLWKRQLGSTADEEAAGVVVAGGHVFVTGWTKGELNGQTKAGDRVIFLVKMDPGSGTPVWTRLLGDAQNPKADFDLSDAIAADSADNLLVAGRTTLDLALDAGQALGGPDSVVFKLASSDGSVLWTQQLTDPISGSNTFSHAIAADRSDDVLVAGATTGSLEAPGSHLGNYDAWVSKLSGVDGSVLWTRQFGTADADEALGVAADSLNNVFVVGFTWGTLNYTSGISASSGQDLFVLKFSSDGTLQWARQIGSVGHDIARAVVVDSSDQLFVAGQTGNSLTGGSFDGGDMFVMKMLASNGSVVWIEQMDAVSGTTFESVYGIVADNHGHLYLGGYSNGAGPGAPSAGGYDSVLLKVDADSGELLWWRQVGSSAEDRGYAVAFDPVSNTAFVAGFTAGGLANGTSTSVGGDDAFVAAFGPSQ